MTVYTFRPRPSAPSDPLPDLDHDEDPMVLAFERLVLEQASHSREYLHVLHKRCFGPRGLFASLSEEIDQLGRQAPALDDIHTLGSAERIQQAESALAFALAKSNRRVAAINPYSGLQREAMCCIAFDDTSTYALVERYVAYEAIRQCDSMFFIKLIATTRGVVERRIVFRGLLEHYDRLLPMEKCIFPEGYRAVQQAHLDREEALNGKLQLDDYVVTLLDTMSPTELLKRVKALSDPLL